MNSIGPMCDKHIFLVVKTTHTLWGQMRNGTALWAIVAIYQIVQLHTRSAAVGTNNELYGVVGQSLLATLKMRTIENNVMFSGKCVANEIVHFTGQR